MIGIARLLAAAAGDPCNIRDQSHFLGFPNWYEYLDGTKVATDPSSPNSVLVCSPQLNGLNDIWLIVAAGIEILLRIAAIVAVAMIIYGGVSYIVSQGEPEATNKARSTIINSLVGLLLSVMAAAFINFIARSIG